MEIRNLLNHFLAPAFFLLIVSGNVFAVEAPRITHKDGRSCLMVDGQPYLILGAQMNNSSEWPSTLPNVWRAVAKMHANMLGAPVYWEQMEPQPGIFDFRNVDELIREAREHQVRLLLLWFGASKNGQMHYAPEWVKTNPARYPRLIGEHGEPLDILASNSATNLDADKHAFAALMRHLRGIDEEQHTVLMVQVENEAGPYYADRDYSPLGNKQFAAAVPAGIIIAMHKKPGSWSQVFGPDANDTFALWSEAHYNTLAAAGKAEFNIPMYVNIAAVNTPNAEAVRKLIDMWKITAPSIDIVGADLYNPDSALYQEMLRAYGRPDNPLWISETGISDGYAKFFFYALGDGAIGFSPFGLDHTEWSLSNDQDPNAHAENYALILPMDREIARLNFEGKLKTAVEEPGHAQQEVALGDWQATVSFGYPQPDRQPPPGTLDFHGRVLIAQLAPNEFLVTGIDARVTFHPPSRPAPADHHINNILRAEEGKYVNGTWTPLRILNGDETQRGLNFQHDGEVVHVTVYRWD